MLFDTKNDGDVGSEEQIAIDTTSCWAWGRAKVGGSGREAAEKEYSVSRESWALRASVGYRRGEKSFMLALHVLAALLVTLVGVVSISNE